MRVLRHDFRLVRLQVPDEVPLDLRQIRERLGLRRQLLRVILAEGPLPVLDTATSRTPAGSRPAARAARPMRAWTSASRSAVGVAAVGFIETSCSLI
jgi:hypothetical protein